MICILAIVTGLIFGSAIAGCILLIAYEDQRTQFYERDE